MSTISKENYLKTIFNCNVRFGDNPTTSQIASELSVSNAAISDMAKKLSEEGFVIYEKYKRMELTKRGEKVALKVIRRHRLWELFLAEVLHLDLSDVHKEAEILEHHTSEFLIDKIDEYLRFPKFDPHGHPIPQKNGSLPITHGLILLSQAEIGNEYHFVRVEDKESELIRYLNNIGLRLNTKIKVVDKLGYDKSVTINFNNKTVSISKKISENLFITNVKT